MSRLLQHKRTRVGDIVTFLNLMYADSSDAVKFYILSEVTSDLTSSIVEFNFIQISRLIMARCWFLSTAAVICQPVHVTNS
jgi:hypothetical protein